MTRRGNSNQNVFCVPTAAAVYATAVVAIRKSRRTRYQVYRYCSMHNSFVSWTTEQVRPKARVESALKCVPSPCVARLLIPFCLVLSIAHQPDQRFQAVRFIVCPAGFRIKDPIKSLDFYTRVLGMRWVNLSSAVMAEIQSFEMRSPEAMQTNSTYSTYICVIIFCLAARNAALVLCTLAFGGKMASAIGLRALRKPALGRCRSVSFYSRRTCTRLVASERLRHLCGFWHPSN